LEVSCNLEGGEGGGGWCGVLLGEFRILLPQELLHGEHASLRYLYCVLVVDFVEDMCFGETSVNDSEEFWPNIFKDISKKK
jgi:hypothetical protein